jgi:hypothetical protein
VTKGLHLPEITPFPREYREADLAKFFKAAYDTEKALYSTFLLTGFREMEVVHRACGSTSRSQIVIVMCH